MITLELVGLHALVRDVDADAPVEEGHLAHAALEHVKAEHRVLLKDALPVVRCLDVRPETHGGAGAAGFADDPQVVLDFAAVVCLLVDPAVLVDQDLHVPGQRVHYGSAHAVQATGDLVAFAAELAPRVQDGQADLHRRALQLGMQPDGKTAPVVLDAQGAVPVQSNLDVGAVPRQGLVNGVVHYFIDQVVKPVPVSGADVHPRPLAHRLQAFQHLNLLFIICRVHMRGHRA